MKFSRVGHAVEIHAGRNPQVQGRDHEWLAAEEDIIADTVGQGLEAVGSAVSSVTNMFSMFGSSSNSAAAVPASPRAARRGGEGAGSDAWRRVTRPSGGCATGRDGRCVQSVR